MTKQEITKAKKLQLESITGKKVKLIKEAIDNKLRKDLINSFEHIQVVSDTILNSLKKGSVDLNLEGLIKTVDMLKMDLYKFSKKLK